MTLNSFHYFAFLALVYLVFRLVDEKRRSGVLLAASWIFYASLLAPQLLAALGLITVISHRAAQRVACLSNDLARRKVYWAATASCVAVLALLKYLPPLLPPWTVATPWAFGLVTAGVSYYTLQAVSYMTDVHLELQEPEPGLARHALALAYFPKLLQGPIERASDLLPQLARPFSYSHEAMRSGLVLFTLGLFKKVIIADRLASYADSAFNNLPESGGLGLLMGVYAYALQIYFDFSAYTDMARGASRLFGIELAENFNNPYLATSVSDFWRRWHMSFSRWLSDYVFKPLQMSWRNGGQVGTAAALLVTFLLSGVWHGASGGFVVWGLLHGIFLALAVFYRPYQARLHKALGAGRNSWWLLLWRRFVTFHLVCFAWIFFRAESLSDALLCVRKLAEGICWRTDPAVVEIITRGRFLGQHRDQLFTLLGAVLVALAVKRLFLHGDPPRSAAVRWLVYAVLAICCLNLGVPNETKFIYIQF